jgi:GDPmannose 4,6-dehydratase
MSTAIITGAAGQDGIYLSNLLRRKGYRVVGLVSPGSDSPARFKGYLDGVDIEAVDIRDGTSLSEVIHRIRPDEIYNLAALSSVGGSWQDAEDVAETNAMAVLRLLDVLLHYRERHSQAPRLYQASSSEVFGVSRDQPQTVSTPHAPRSPYAAAKSFAHNLTVGYRETHGLFACNGILFNHESPLRPPRFVARKITRAVAEITTGRRRTLTLGNTEARRDWGAAADYVEAMWLMLQQDVAADYVIATGTTASISEVVGLAFSCVGIDDPTPYVAVDPALMRPADIPQAWGDPSEAQQRLGWSATPTLAELVAAMVAADVERIRTGVEESPALLGW